MQTRRYRLIARPPFTVVFPSVVYRIEVEHVQASAVDRLSAFFLGEERSWILVEARPPRFEALVYSTGFEIPYPTVADVIMARLVRDGRAELLA